MGTLDGKVAIVTGAARGLGRAYAKRLAGLGAKVAVADLNLHSYEEFEAEAKDMTAGSTVAEIEAAGGIALGIEVDGAGRPGMGPSRCLGRECGRRSWSAHRYQGQNPRSGAPSTRDGNEPVRDRLFV
jgi:NAD(P)-dependent dehydrogenase (short-subunit alcohol dehydrogenase family)